MTTHPEIQDLKESRHKILLALNAANQYIRNLEKAIEHLNIQKEQLAETIRVYCKEPV